MWYGNLGGYLESIENSLDSITILILSSAVHLLLLLLPCICKTSSTALSKKSLHCKVFSERGAGQARVVIGLFVAIANLSHSGSVDVKWVAMDDTWKYIYECVTHLIIQQNAYTIHLLLQHQAPLAAAFGFVPGLKTGRG
jgi:hypothetical protein